ncbi:DNA-DIRECTED RNA POLYMERASE II, III, putative [Babesia caballi]|uniref:DNA-DIRECTED RNA POLYMERASE II, III, putative n=1 Tax=Babesia caballi TaxID=5871 RepID=A0AAV4LP70_BABCB|nr:DNA-DIRECTED RNA POLYMERASE II, III, putative [Babesia caballi]
MFKSFLVEDLITLEVAEYLDDARKSLTQKVEDKYVDRAGGGAFVADSSQILAGVGLVVLVQDFAFHCEPRILPNDASALFTLRLKLLVFAPERDEQLRGTVVGSDASGISVSLGFFSDIKIIPLFMPKNAAFDRDAKAWYTVQGDARRYYKNSAAIQFKVVEVTYNEVNGKGSGGCVEWQQTHRVTPPCRSC